MITWQEFSESIRRSVLRDVDAQTWDENQLYDCIRWALDDFCHHTAYPVEWVITGEEEGIDLTATLSLDLPYDVYQPQVMGTTAYVYKSKEGTTPIVYDPVRYTRNITPANGQSPHYQVRNNQLVLSEVIGEGWQLTVLYFAHYPLPHPSEWDTVVSFPRWAEKPLATLVGAYALESQAVESANIDRWKDKLDSGNPEHNSLRVQQDYLMKLYERLLLKHTAQDRENHWRNQESF